MKALLVLAAALLAGCHHSTEWKDDSLSSVPQAKSICEVSSNPDGYLGSYVAIRGLYFSDPHHRYMLDKDCSEIEVDVRLSVNADSSQSEQMEDAVLSKKQGGEISVVYYGALRSEEKIAGCVEADCRRFILEDARLLRHVY